MIPTDHSETVPKPLTDSRARYLLYCLQLHTTPMSLPDIAEQLTVWEQDTREGEFPDRRLRIYDALHHDHLPRLQQADIVTYEPATEEYTGVVESEFESEIVRPLEAERTRFQHDGTQ